MKLKPLSEEATKERATTIKVLTLYLKQLMRIHVKSRFTSATFSPVHIFLAGRTPNYLQLVFVFEDIVNLEPPYKQLEALSETFGFKETPFFYQRSKEIHTPPAGFIAGTDGNTFSFTDKTALLLQTLQNLKHGVGLLNRSGLINKKLFEAIYYMRFNIPGKFGWKKLSDLYQSRTTNLSGVYHTDCFIISDKREDILAAGYQSTTKLVIQLNTANPMVRRVLQSIEKTEAEWKGKHSPSLTDVYQNYLNTKD